MNEVVFDILQSGLGISAMAVAWSVAVCCPSCLQRLDRQFPICRRWLIERTIGKWEGNYQSLKSKMNQRQEFHIPIFIKIFKSSHIYEQNFKINFFTNSDALLSLLNKKLQFWYSVMNPNHESITPNPQIEENPTQRS